MNEWHKWFKEGQDNVEDTERSGHPKTHIPNTNVEKVQQSARHIV